jgi:hypothetical protein
VLVVRLKDGPDEHVSAFQRWRKRIAQHEFRHSKR